MKHLIRSVIVMVQCLFYYKSLKLFFSNHMTIGIRKLYKNNVIFPHPVGIVIGMKVKIGEGCVIYQGVTIGTKDTNNYRNAKYPRLGKNVIVYPNSIIIGDIDIGDNVVIGAGSIVMKSISPNKTVCGAPAKIIK